MAPQVSQNLSKIKASSVELNQLADEATEQIRALGKFLDDLSPGIEVFGSVFLHGREENSSGHRTNATYRLAYCRDDSGKFGLNVSAEAEKTDDEGQVIVDHETGGLPEAVTELVWQQRLDQQSRQIRIAAMATSPDFIDQLSRELDETVKTVKDNIEKTRASLAELKDALQATKPTESATQTRTRVAALPKPQPQKRTVPDLPKSAL